MDISKFSTTPTITTDGRTIIHTEKDYQNLGKLLIILDIRTTDPPIDKESLDEFVDKAISAYYGFDGTNIETSQEADPETRLEGVADFINKSAGRLFENMSPSEIKRNVSVFVGVIIDNTLLFTKTDQIQILMKHSDNLVSIADEQSGPNDPILSYITSGEISDGDSMLITTDALLDYFSHAKIKKILTEKNANDASAEFKSLVEEFAQQTFFHAIILKNERAKKETKQKYSEYTRIAQSSISKFNDVEASTGDLLSNSFWLATKKSLQSLGKNLTQTRKEKAELSPVADNETRIRYAAKKRRQQRNPLNKINAKLKIAIKSAWIIISWVGAQFLSIVQNLFRNRHGIIEGVTGVGKSIPQKITNSVSRAGAKYKTLDNRRRKLLFSVVALVIVLIISVAYGTSSRPDSMSKEEVLALFDEIEVKRASAEAAILYGNEQQAVNLISEARRLLNRIDIKSGDLKSRKEDLARNMLDTYKSLQKLEEIDSPTVIADLNAQAGEQQRTIKGLSGNGSVFYAFDDQNTIYRLNALENSVESVGRIPESVENVLMGENGEIFAYTSSEEAKIYQLDIENGSADKVDITFANPLSKKEAIIPYFSRMYTLDPRERQIFKHQLVGSTYTKGSPWVTDTSVDLSSAKDMAIDGNIWVVTGNGELIKLTSGERQNFNLELLDPPLNSPNTIWTSVDSKYLYVLDPPTHRLIILTKDGKIYKQYVSQEWSDLKGISVNEDDNKIYLLSGNKIFSIDLP